MTAAADLVFLLDVDNTLLDNDRIQEDLRERLASEFGPACRDRYWAILQQLWDELGYRDYLGALQRYRVEHPYEAQLLSVSSWLVDYPFADRLYPSALAVLARLEGWGQTVILSDGDVVFQPRKVEQSGLWRAVSGRVLIYIHKEKELVDIERRYPARRYVVVDDKLWILAAFKGAWGERVTTVLPRQGQYAHDTRALAASPPADHTIERLDDLLEHDLAALSGGRAERWDNAVEQGTYVARALTGEHTPFVHVPYFFSDVFDLSYEYWGDAEATDTVGYRGDISSGRFSAWWLKNGRVRAAFVLNKPGRRARPRESVDRGAASGTC